jgi:acyl carrier protein
MTLMEQVTSIFREVFDDPELVVTEDTNASHIEDWDSIAQINLIIAFEDKFKVKFVTKELDELTCVGDMIKLLQSKGVK